MPDLDLDGDPLVLDDAPLVIDQGAAAVVTGDDDLLPTVTDRAAARTFIDRAPNRLVIARRGT